MSTALALQSATPEQIELIRATVAKGATNDELKLFLYQCQRLGLDPLSKQVHFVKYGTSPGTIITGVDGFRVVAHRTGKLAGIKRGALRNAEGKLVGGWAEVYRSDWAHPAREEVPLSEYIKPTNNWKNMPETMIKKVAECAALRMAFPSDLSGIYGQEEMDQAPAPTPPEAPPAPPKDVSPQPDVIEDGLITPPQLKRLFAIIGDQIKKGTWTEEEAKEYIYATGKVTSTKDLKQSDYERICEFIEHGTQVRS